jgi:hypothetical protein
MPQAAAVGAGLAIAGVGSALIQNSSDRKARHAAGAFMEQGTAQAKGDINKYFGMAEQGFDPWITAGTGAENIIADLNGVNGPEAQSAAYERFKSDPSYRFQVDQANQALQRSAIGGNKNLFSGNFADASNRLNQGLASQSYGNYYNRLMGMSDTGLNATSTRSNIYGRHGTALANADLGLATNLAGSEIAQGQSKANMYGDMFSSLASGAGAYYAMQGIGGAPTTGTTSSSMYQPTANPMNQYSSLPAGVSNYGTQPYQYEFNMPQRQQFAGYGNSYGGY